MILNFELGCWFSLMVLTLVYVIGELSHFLMGIVTRPMSQEIHYGNIECLSNPNASAYVPDSNVETHNIRCYEAFTEELCSFMGSFNATDESGSACVWDYSGLGIEYQILAGPAFVAVFTISGIFIGILADKFSRKWVVTWSLLLLVVATTITGSATAYWHLVILRMLVGAGESAFAPACSSMISDMFSPVRRGLALGIFNWGIYFGYGLSYAVGNFITAADINDMGWRFSFYFSGILGFVVVALLLLLVGEPERGTVTSDPSNEATKDAVDLTLSDIRIPEGKGNSVDSPSKRIDLSSPPEPSKLKQVMSAVFNPLFIMLMIAACVRHTGGFSWAYNTQLYFSTYYPNVNLGLWITACSIIGGTLGVVVGGFVSDRLVKKLGIKARIYVLAASQLIATPFAAGVLSFPPPYAFYSLMVSYLFAEMWFGVLFAVLLEIIPPKVQSTTIAVFLFVMNNIGGNAPVIVEPIRAVTSYRTALYILYPGNYLLSAILFLTTSFFVKTQKT